MANRSNQERDYDPGEDISLGMRTNSELIAACHRVAERYDMSSAAWMRSVIAPIIAKELGVSPAVLEPFGGFDTRAPSVGGSDTETIEEQIARATPEQQKLIRSLLATTSATGESGRRAKRTTRAPLVDSEPKAVTRRR